MDRDAVFGLLGRKVGVRLNSVEARGAEIVGTLREAREDGIVLSEIGELGPGPTLLCPWDSLHLVQDRPPWLASPYEKPEEEAQGQELYDLEEVPEERVAPEPMPGRRDPSARTLERVVSVAQKVEVRGTTVAIASLELYEKGIGLLRWQISLGLEALRNNPGFGFDVPEPEFEIRDDTGRSLPWSPRGAGYSDDEADGYAQVEGLPNAGSLEVEVTRLVSDAYGDGEYRGEGASYEGPWIFRFTL